MLLTKDNYFSKEANLEYMSNSQYKSFIDCEARTMAGINGEYEFIKSIDMQVGSYIHAWNEGVNDEFIEENPDIFSTKGPTKGELKSQFKKADKCIEMIKNDPLLSKSLSGEKEKIFTSELFGSKWKICIDSYFPKEKRFGDLKVLQSLDKTFFCEKDLSRKSIFEYFGYFTQMAIYAEIERLANKRVNGDYFEPFLTVVTKEEIPNKEIISFVSSEENIFHFVSKKLEIVEENMERIIQVKSKSEEQNRCEKCKYCVGNKKLIGTTHYSYYRL